MTHSPAQIASLHRPDPGPLERMEVLRESPRFVVVLQVGASANAPSYGPSPCPLTARERDVLRLIAKGYQAPEVAGVLGLSRHTVRGYVRDVYRKLGISSRAEATMEAVQRGLVR